MRVRTRIGRLSRTRTRAMASETLNAIRVRSVSNARPCVCVSMGNGGIDFGVERTWPHFYHAVIHCFAFVMPLLFWPFAHACPRCVAKPSMTISRHCLGLGCAVPRYSAFVNRGCLAHVRARTQCRVRICYHLLSTCYAAGGHFGSYRSSTVAAPYLNRVCCLVFTLLSGRGAVPLRCASQWCAGSLAAYVSPLFHRC